MIQLRDLKSEYETIRPEIHEAINRVLESGQYVKGEDVGLFEQEFASILGKGHCVGVNSGTTALEIVLQALGIGRGDEVITTPMSFIATSEAISNARATPVWVDIDETYNINPNLIERAITKKTKAILLVHLHGRPCDLKAIYKIARKHDLLVIEDCAQAHLVESNIGTVPHSIGIFSFYPSKNLGAYGDGGAIVTDSTILANDCRQLIDHGRLDNKYEHTIIGHGCRLNTLQAAILRVKLKYLQEWTKQRQEIAREYNKVFKLPDVPGHVYHNYIIEVENRDEVQKKLKEVGIATGIHYPIPIHKQKAYNSKYSLPVSEEKAKRILTIPLVAGLAKKIQEVIDA